MKRIICPVFILLQVSYAFCDCICSLPCPDGEPSIEDIDYYLYKNANSDPIKINFDNPLDYQSELSSTLKITFIIHGFLQNASVKWMIDMKNKLFIQDSNQYIVLVDWSKISSVTNYYDVVNGFYPFTALKTCCTGDRLAVFILYLSQRTGTKSSNIHLIGHSLGAHVAGCAGQKFFNLTSEKLGHVTGMDAAGPAFQVGTLEVSKDCRLSEDDAVFVDAYHTNQFLFGYTGRLGHVDFIINNGYYQPCTTDCCLLPPYNLADESCDLLTCSHSFVLYFYIESIDSNKFLATQCEDWTKYECGRCDNNDEYDEIVAGLNIDKSARGVFYVDTKSTCNYPFAQNGAKICPNIFYNCPNPVQCWI